MATGLPTLDTTGQLSGLWSFLARGFWLVTAFLMATAFAIACVHIYQFYLTPCATWTIDASCERVVGFLTSQGFGVRWLALVNVLSVVLVALPWMVVACLVFVQRGKEVSGWMLSLALLTGWASDLTNVNVRHHVWWALEDLPLGAIYWQQGFVYFVSFISQATILLLGFLLPDGRFKPRWTLYFAWVWAVYMLFETLYRYPFLEMPSWFLYPESFFTFSAPLLAVFALAYRYRSLKRVSKPNQQKEHSQKQDEQRRQLETILPSMITLVVTYTLMTALLFVFWRFNLPWLDDTVLRYSHDLLQNLLQAACACWFSAALAIAMFRHQLFALELFVNRTLVYAGVSFLLLAVYLGVVFGVGFFFQERQTFWVSLLATALIALLFQPLRERLQGWVNQRFYGRRDEPFEVMRQVGEHVQLLAPQDLLPGLVETLQETFRLPYVAITVYNSVWSQGSRTVNAGTPGKRVVRFPLVAGGELGVLEVSPRSYETFSPREEKLLETIAKEIAVAARSLRLSLELQASREHLVTTREEERRRLQRDLHDGLGPTLAAQTLKIGAARSLLQGQPEQADKVLEGLEADLRGTLGYVRQLVYSLRPPLLDQLGLGRALEQRLIEQLAQHKVRLNFVVAELPPLPAAVEVASYFIISEAFHNVLRHAGATTCDIRIALLADEASPRLGQPYLSQPCSGQKLELVICDDGGSDSLVLPVQEGVGLSSMRERCEELGGVLELSRERGLCIRALLPLPSQPPQLQSESST